MRKHFATTKAFCRRLGNGENCFYDGFFRKHMNCRIYSELQLELLYQSFVAFEIVYSMFV